MRLYDSGAEGFYDPSIDQIIGNDRKVWQYNFLMDEDEAFPQEQGQIYWLGVQAVVDTGLPMPLWGWKTSLDHWNDDAVWGEGVYVPPDLMRHCTRLVTTLPRRAEPNGRYHYLEFSSDVPIVPSLIDFKHYFSVNVEYLKKLKPSRFVCKVAEVYR